MFKVGDKVKIEAVRNGGNLAKVHDVVTVTGIISDLGFMAITVDGDEVYVCYDFDDSVADYLAGSIVTTEAEKRGAKFGVMGVVKNGCAVFPSGTRVVFNSVRKDACRFSGKEVWVVMSENIDDSTFGMISSNIRLDHEPEFVAWSEAPEHLRYDASRVYHDGKPVKWIAKPEGSFVKAVVVLENGCMEFTEHKLTVKL